jgi:hypothetical protein
VLRDLEVIIEKILEALGARPCWSKKGKQIMDCINRGSEPKSKDVILLL